MQAIWICSISGVGRSSRTSTKGGFLNNVGTTPPQGSGEAVVLDMTSAISFPNLIIFPELRCHSRMSCVNTHRLGESKGLEILNGGTLSTVLQISAWKTCPYKGISQRDCHYIKKLSEPLANKIFHWMLSPPMYRSYSGLISCPSHPF